MSTDRKYEPEDIAQLLKEKRFDELLTEEKTFVLQHISSAEEYQQMRGMMGILEQEKWNDNYEAPPDLRKTLINQHKEKNKRTFTVWLNTFFFGAGTDRSWYQGKGFQLGIATLLVVGTILFVSKNDVQSGQQLAEKIEHTSEEKKTAEMKEPKKAPSVIERAEEAADKEDEDSPKPSAPTPPMPTTIIEIVEDDAGFESLDKVISEENASYNWTSDVDDEVEADPPSINDDSYNFAEVRKDDQGITPTDNSIMISDSVISNGSTTNAPAGIIEDLAEGEFSGVDRNNNTSLDMADLEEEEKEEDKVLKSVETIEITSQSKREAVSKLFKSKERAVRKSVSLSEQSEIISGLYQAF